LGILGPTGSGKSSLIHLITRLYDYDHGSIKIDGVELKEIDKKWEDCRKRKSSFSHGEKRKLLYPLYPPIYPR